MSSRLLGVWLSPMDWSCSKVRELFSLEFSTLIRARRRLSSMDWPNMKLPSIVAEAIE